MITCLPQGICSWNYRLLGLPEGEAAIQFNWFGEAGAIEYAGLRYSVDHAGWLSGQWSLSCKGDLLAEARKPSAMFRQFDVTCEDVVYDLQPDHAFTRNFTLRLGGVIAASIRPVHPFTRRATIETRGDVPPEVVLLSFWVVALMWRRAAQDAS